MPRPRKIEWPDGARICMTFIVPWEVWPENFATAASGQRTAGHHIPPADAPFTRSMSAVTEREYGDRTGIWRLLDTFERYDIKASLLLNGVKAEELGREENADLLAEVQSQGHEYASEGYVHEYSYMYTREQEDESMKKTIKAFEDAFGQRPTGYLSPGHCFTDNTLDLVAENGYTWWADPLNDDQPYILESGNKKVVVIPYNISGCNDYSTYKGDRTPRDLMGIWRDQFDQLYDEGEQGYPKFFSINFHPFVSGVPYRTKVIREFLDYVRSHSKVWFAPRIEMANWFLKQGY